MTSFKQCDCKKQRDHVVFSDLFCSEYCQHKEIILQRFVDPNSVEDPS